MYYASSEIKDAVTKLASKYPDKKINNSKIIESPTEKPLIITENYKAISMKRSSFRNISFIKSSFENVALSGSSFIGTSFSNCVIMENSFACCNFFNSSFYSNKKNNYTGNNFSQTNFTACDFLDSDFKGNGFLQTIFNKCNIVNVNFGNNTFEGSKFINCKIKKTDFSNTNIEFVEIINNQFNDVSFPFYQFAYIIGASDYINNESSGIHFKIDKKIISLEEYREQINNLILYYLDKSEYFPACNLKFMINEKKEASEILLEGINYALKDLDFRLIRHCCRLAQNLDLLNESLTKRIIDSIENYLTTNTISPEQINQCIIHYGEIHSIIYGNNKKNVSFNINIRTNITSNNIEGKEYIDSLCKRLNNILSKKIKGQRGFRVAVSNFSPFEIIIDVICAAGSVATIAQMIWTIIDKHNCETSVFDDYTVIDTDVYNKYIDTRIDNCKLELLRIKNEYSKKEMNKYIEEITQKLKTDLQELYQQDIMIFKKNNNNDIS